MKVDNIINETLPCIIAVINTKLFLNWATRHTQCEYSWVNN